MLVLTADEMRAADADATAALGDVALMRNAGVALADRILHHLRARAGTDVVAFAGPGNNGGDAFAALAEIAGLNTGYRCRVYADEQQRVSAGRADAERHARESGVIILPLPSNEDEATVATDGACVVVDAMFGTGARLPVDARYHPAIHACNVAAGAVVVAADIPTGVDATTGAVADVAVRAHETASFGAVKAGALLEPGRAQCGYVHAMDIGIGDATLREHATTFRALDAAEFRALLPQRPEQADKRSSGAPLIVAGSEQFPGAAVLCARAAARAGAGYVTLVAPKAAAVTLRAHLLEQVVVTIDPQQSPQRAIETILDLAHRNGSIGIGPGMSLDDWTGEVVRGVLAGTTLPVVADASALFHLAKHLDALRGRTLLVTPHESEFARLSGKGSVAPGTRVTRLREFVERTGVQTLLKGNATLIYSGELMYINTTGTNALATAGTGDVLTGVIATLMSQGLSPVNAARTGAYWHGLAGQYAAKTRPHGVIASDVIESLAAATLPGSSG